MRGIVAISGGRFETQTLMLVCSCYRQVYMLRLCLVGKPWEVCFFHTSERVQDMIAFDRSCVRLSGVVLGALAQWLAAYTCCVDDIGCLARDTLLLLL